MLNYIWFFMIVIGVIYGFITGNIEKVGSGAIESACVFRRDWQAGQPGGARRSGLSDCRCHRRRRVIQTFPVRVPSGAPR